MRWIDSRHVGIIREFERLPRLRAVHRLYLSCDAIRHAMKFAQAADFINFCHVFRAFNKLLNNLRQKTRKTSNEPLLGPFLYLPFMLISQVLR